MAELKALRAAHRLQEEAESSLNLSEDERSAAFWRRSDEIWDRRLKKWGVNRNPIQELTAAVPESSGGDTSVNQKDDNAGSSQVIGDFSEPEYVPLLSASDRDHRVEDLYDRDKVPDKIPEKIVWELSSKEEERKQSTVRSTTVADSFLAKTTSTDAKFQDAVAKLELSEHNDDYDDVLCYSPEWMKPDDDEGGTESALAEGDGDGAFLCGSNKDSSPAKAKLEVDSTFELFSITDATTIPEDIASVPQNQRASAPTQLFDDPPVAKVCRLPIVLSFEAHENSSLFIGEQVKTAPNTWIVVATAFKGGGALVLPTLECAYDTFKSWVLRTTTFKGALFQDESFSR